MITARAIASLDALIYGALSDAASIPGSDPCNLVLMDYLASPAEPQSDHGLTMCNISAFNFRLVLFCSFLRDRQTCDFLRAKFRIADEVPDGEVLGDASAEFLNMVCGSAKGGLTAAFPVTGMSTPFRLDRRCQSHLEALKPAHSRFLGVTGYGGVRFDAGYCVCVSRNSSIDFVLPKPSPEDSATGDLELF